MNTEQTPKTTKSKFTTVIITLLLISLVACLWFFWQYQQAQAQAKKDAELALVSREAVLQKIQSLSRLETTGMTIETIITTQKQGNWYNLWQDHHKGLFVIRGRVQAGIDLNKLSAESISTDDTGKTTAVTLPPVEIFQVYLDNIDVYDYQKGILGKQIDRQVFNKIQSSAKQQVLNKACQAEILKLANESAQKQVQALFDLVNNPIIINKQASPSC